MPEKTRPTRTPQPIGGGTGRPVDEHGSPAIDPTENVIALTTAANKRQDDLREAFESHFKAEVNHVKELAALRAAHATDLLRAEAERASSIRHIDQQNVGTASERALTAINALANSTAANAETMRNALNSTAATLANQQAATVAAVNERISALERTAYEGFGKQAYSDPLITQLLAKVNGLVENASGNTGRSTGVGATWAAIALGVSVLTGLITIGTFVFITTRTPSTPTIYTPSPAGTMLPSTPPATPPPR